MFGYFAGTKKNNGNVVIVLRAEYGIHVDVNFMEPGAEFAEEGRHLRLSLFAEVATDARVERHIERPGHSEAARLGPQEAAGVAGCGQQALVHHPRENRAGRVLLPSRRRGGGALLESLRSERFTDEFVKRFQHGLGGSVHRDLRFF